MNQCGKNNSNWQGGKFVKCDYCGKEIWRKPFQLKKFKNHYCSKEHSDKSIERAEESKKRNLGKKASPELREKFKKINTGEGNPFYGKHCTEEHKEKIRQANKGRKPSALCIERVKQRWDNPEFAKKMKRILREEGFKKARNSKKKDTSIELKVEAELKQRDIYYEKQVLLCKIALVDFYLPQYRIVIQCDGNYWHSFKKAKNKDINQDFILTFNGFNVYRFTETEINKNVKRCINGIQGLDNWLKVLK